MKTQKMISGLIALFLMLSATACTNENNGETTTNHPSADEEQEFETSEPEISDDGDLLGYLNLSPKDLMANTIGQGTKNLKIIPNYQKTEDSSLKKGINAINEDDYQYLKNKTLEEIYNWIVSNYKIIHNTQPESKDYIFGIIAWHEQNGEQIPLCYINTEAKNVEKVLGKQAYSLFDSCRNETNIERFKNYLSSQNYWQNDKKIYLLSFGKFSIWRPIYLKEIDGNEEISNPEPNDPPNPITCNPKDDPDCEENGDGNSPPSECDPENSDCDNDEDNGSIWQPDGESIYYGGESVHITEGDLHVKGDIYMERAQTDRFGSDFYYLCIGKDKKIMITPTPCHEQEEPTVGLHGIENE